MDNLTKDQRHRNMQAIKSKDTTIEIMLRKELRQRGIGYRKHYKNLAGTPDITLTKYKIAIFCDSDFWHGRDWENSKYKLKSNTDYWIPKIERNMQRDKEVNADLQENGWTVFRFWERDIKKNITVCIDEIFKTIDAIKNRSPRM